MQQTFVTTAKSKTLAAASPVDVRDVVTIGNAFLSLSLIIGLIVNTTLISVVGIIISPVVLHIIGILLLSLIIISR
ncbi:MAG: hypothetical protein DWQ05_16240 [Calditrichaeota bacterium]|nr:MAG: hypothetical protein DWQ05_16240 [Calditrichota bacterium]